MVRGFGTALGSVCLFALSVGAANAASKTCDEALKAFKPDNQTSVVFVKPFAKGDTIILSEPATPYTQTATADLCLVKLLVGPGNPGPADAPSTSPGIGIEVWLPLAERWNERVHVLGGGGFDGGPHGTARAIGEPRAAATAAREGAVTAHSDGGHPRRGAVPGQGKGGADFGMLPDGSLNTVLWKDFASRAIHETAVKTKALAAFYYGRPARYAYFEGSSNGGRQAFALAQTHPDDFDGIIGSMPAINWSSFMVGDLYPQLVFQRDLGGAVPSEAKQDLVSNAAIRACDTVGGVHLGYILEASACRYDPTKDPEVLCTSDGGRNGTPDCVTRQEARSFNKIWYGPTADGSAPDPAVDNGWDRKLGGARRWYGFPRGTSLYNATFSRLFRTSAGVTNPEGPFTHATDMVAIVLGDPKLAWNNFENATGNGQDGWKRLSYAQLAAVPAKGRALQTQLGGIDTDNPDLSAFAARGGKFLSWHGVHDEAIPVQGTTQYYDQVTRTMGGLAKVQSFFRLYIVPGMGHATPNGTSNPVASPPIVDPEAFYQRLVDWVEKGAAPDRLDLQSPAGRPTRNSQPICPYPQAATFVSGDPREAESYRCAVRKP